MCCLQKFVCQTVDEAERREEKEGVTRKEKQGGEKGREKREEDREERGKRQWEKGTKAAQLHLPLTRANKSLSLRQLLTVRQQAELERRRCHAPSCTAAR